MKRPIWLIENPSELGAGIRGASLGIPALHIAAFSHGSNLLLQFPKQEIPSLNECLVHPNNHSWAKYIDCILEIYERTAEAVHKVLIDQQGFPLIVAGDHSTAGGTIAGIKMAFPDKRLGVVWIDAHADLHSPYTTPSGNVHGMPLAASMGFDQKDRQRNQVAPATEDYWEQLKNLGGICPKLLPEDILCVGVRDTEPEEDAILLDCNITNYLVDRVRHLGVPLILEKIFAQLEACDLLYVSFDVDSLDPDLVSHGTGTPSPNGLTPQEASELLQGFWADPRLVALEVTEINPTLDEKGNTMAETAFQILESVLQPVRV